MEQPAQEHEIIDAVRARVRTRGNGRRARGNVTVEAGHTAEAHDRSPLSPHNRGLLLSDLDSIASHHFDFGYAEGREAGYKDGYAQGAEHSAARTRRREMRIFQAIMQEIEARLFRVKEGLAAKSNHPDHISRIDAVGLLTKIRIDLGVLLLAWSAGSFEVE